MREEIEARGGEPGNELNVEIRNWAMGCHLIALVGLLGNGIGFLLGPLIVWAAKRDTHPFIDDQGREAVNFQITMLLATLVAFALCFVLVGFVLLPAVGIVDVIFCIIAGLKANEGVRYRYPLNLRLIK